jgi:hypothetical protein
LLGRKAFSQQVDDQIEQLGARHQLFLWAAGPAFFKVVVASAVFFMLPLFVAVAPCPG